jgi:hypothetical protein
MGEPITHLYRDRESWVDMYTRYYTDHEPQSAWVAVAADQRVVGYLLGCLDTREHVHEVWFALRHNLSRFLWLRPGTARFWWRAAWDLLADLRAPRRPTIDLGRYPAHMHCNMLAEARGRGVAEELFAHFHAALRERGIPGVHGEAYASNGRVHGLLRKLGYRGLGQAYPIPGLRARDGTRLYGQAVVCDLSMTEIERAPESRLDPRASTV